jgi:hypothetical protein
MVLHVNNIHGVVVVYVVFVYQQQVQLLGLLKCGDKAAAAHLVVVANGAVEAAAEQTTVLVDTKTGVAEVQCRCVIVLVLVFVYHQAVMGIQDNLVEFTTVN